MIFFLYNFDKLDTFYLESSSLKKYRFDHNSKKHLNFQ